MPKESTAGCVPTAFFDKDVMKNMFMFFHDFFVCRGHCHLLRDCRKPISAKKGIYLTDDPFSLKNAAPPKLTCPLKKWWLEE